MSDRSLLLSLVMSAAFSVFGIPHARGEEFDAAQAQQAWRSIWERFYHPGSQTFMDYLSSYQEGRELDHLPSADEVRRQYPNPCGYGTGMEDGMILGGAMLSAICDRFAVTGERGLRDQSDKVFRGMQRCATVHGVTGFVARNVCPEDQSSVYINSSRDQVTHFVHGLWRYYHSPLSDDHTRQQIRELLSAVADRMIRFVIPKNDYDFCRADGSRCPLGICRMWNVKPHEAARLPMIYAAAWDVTGEQRFRNQWRRYIAQAVEQSQESVEQHPVYALLQMQCSLEVLHDLEPDQELKHGIAAIMHHLADLGRRNQARALRKITAMSDDKLAMLGPDWRQSENWINQGGYANPQWGPYRSVWHLVREAGESALIPLMDPAGKVSTDQQHQLASLLDRIDYDHNSSCGIVYHVAAYWKMQRNLANQMSKD